MLEIDYYQNGCRYIFGPDKYFKLIRQVAARYMVVDRLTRFRLIVPQMREICKLLMSGI